MSSKAEDKQVEDSDQKDRWGLILFIAFFVIIALWVAYWQLGSKIAVNGLDGLNEFGDSFGALNTLFSGLAFAGIIITIFMQRQELRLQRKELEETRKVAADQANTLERQRFENTFFQMLDLYEKKVLSLEKKGNPTFQGRKCFESVMAKEVVVSDILSGSKKTGVFFKFSMHCFSYLKIVHRILLLIHQSNFEDKPYYMNTFRSLMSKRELEYLFAVALVEAQCDDLKFLFEKLGFWYDFEEMEWGTLSEDHIKMYDKSAYCGVYPKAAAQ